MEKAMDKTAESEYSVTDSDAEHQAAERQPTLPRKKCISFPGRDRRSLLAKIRYLRARLAQNRGAQRAAAYQREAKKSRPSQRKQKPTPIEIDYDSDNKAGPSRFAKTRKAETFEPFKKCAKIDRVREFRDWMETVEAAMSFAKGWSEKQKINFFCVKCGSYLSSIIKAFNLKPTVRGAPFDQLIRNIDAHFEKASDPTMEHRAVLDCKQKQGESAEDFHLRLVQLVRYKGYSESMIRAHFLRGLIDQKYASLVDSLGKTIIEIVNGAMIREEDNQAMEPVPNPAPKPVDLAPVNVDAVRYVSERGYDAGKPAAARRKPEASLKTCSRCGVIFPHKNGFCPAKQTGRTCSSCGKPGHFSRMCRSKDAMNRRSLNQVSNPGSANN